MPEIQMPKLSDTMAEGTLVAWKKKKGDQVSAGEVLAEIETDKATMEWESPEDGTLAEGVVDLAFREDGAWIVIDFKTDRELAAAQTTYEAQVRLYARAVAAATGESARGVLLRV